jgi:hypothetical protein
MAAPLGLMGQIVCKAGWVRLHRNAICALVTGTDQHLNLLGKTPGGKVAFDAQLPRHGQDVARLRFLEAPHIPQGARAIFVEGAGIQRTQARPSFSRYLCILLSLMHEKHHTSIGQP